MLFKIKPGKKTSENIYTLVGGVISMSVAMGWISPDVATTLTEVGGQVAQVDTSSVSSVVDGAMRIVALVMGGTIVNTYIKGRSNIKAQLGKAQDLVEDLGDVIDKQISG